MCYKTGNPGACGIPATPCGTTSSNTSTLFSIPSTLTGSFTYTKYNSSGIAIGNNTVTFPLTFNTFNNYWTTTPANRPTLVSAKGGVDVLVGITLGCVGSTLNQWELRIDEFSLSTGAFVTNQSDTLHLVPTSISPYLLTTTTFFQPSFFFTPSLGPIAHVSFTATP